jgi:hypothetical protein
MGAIKPPTLTRCEMTYKNLLEFIKTLSPEQLEQNVAIYDCEHDEYHPSHSATFTVGDDVLDDNHAILIIK